ncbi:hypothetical protein EVAR_90940_1 [Eumeta japonica]|uniref:DUF5641 domain-containing protein n=1 Tax=Eumeta variegata TaxID=151549 RepID=A0A4C1SGD4_EUMVA|nr:hypothetical protein EVAR_90940_1 [Eumeta japonica]
MKPTEPLTGEHPSARLAHHQTVHLHGPGLLRPVLGHRGPQHTIRGPIHVFDHASRSSRARGVPLHGRSDTHSQALRSAPRCPTEIWSDRGTNFVGADNELRRERYGRSKKASEHLVRWRYIPPGAPFMGEPGSAWSSRRPLTHVSVSAEDPEALTNHFLLGGAARVPTPGAFVEADLNSRQQWRRAQRLADHFWQRWLRVPAAASTTPFITAERDAAGGRRHGADRRREPAAEHVAGGRSAAALSREGWRGTSGGAADGCRALEEASKEDRRPPEMKCKNCTAGECCGRQCIVIRCKINH